jgi:hypothetical protein
MADIGAEEVSAIRTMPTREWVTIVNGALRKRLEMTGMVETEAVTGAKGLKSRLTALGRSIKLADELCDSDRSAEGGETRRGSTEGDSAGPKDIAQTDPGDQP